MSNPVKFAGRTGSQVQAIERAKLAGFSTTASTISFDGTLAQGLALVNQTIANEADKCVRIALHAVRRAFEKAMKADAETPMTVDELRDPQRIGDAISGALDAEPEPEPDTTGAETDRLARIDAAKAESAALKAWKTEGSNGEPPATPNLNALGIEANNRKPNGAKKSTRRSGSRSSTPKVDQPAPKAERGQAVVALRNDKHGDVVTAALKSAKVSPEVAKVDGRFLVLRNADGQQVFDALVSATDGQGQFATRLLTLAGLGVRHACPKVTDTRNSLVARLVTALIESGKTWTVGAATDATPTFVIDGNEFATAKAAAASLGVSTKAAA